MEGQPEMEPRNQGEQLDLERGSADYEWRRWQRAQVRRNTLQLVSAVAQWILLLTCLVQLGLGFLHSSPVRLHDKPHCLLWKALCTMRSFRIVTVHISKQDTHL